MKKNIFRSLATASLAGVLAFTSIPTGLLETRAAVLQDERPQDHPTRYNRDNDTAVGASSSRLVDVGSSESTTFKFGLEDLHTNNSVGADAKNTFRIAALKTDSDRALPARGYTSPEIKTNFGSTWWHTRYAFGTEAQVAPQVTYSGATPTAASFPSASSVLKNFDTPYNGAVATASGLAEDGTTTVNLEVRQKVSTSADDEIVVVEYTVYNPSDKSVNFWIGNETDTQMHKSDDTPIMKTNSGFTMHASHGNEGQLRNNDGSEGKQYQFSDFRAFIENPAGKDWGLGVQKRPGADLSHTRSWIGQWEYTAGLDHEAFIFANSPNAYANVSDSAAGFSAYLHLLGHETKTVRFGIRMRTSVYYVDKDYAGGNSNGFISRPYTKIEDAINAMRDNGVKKGYIALLSDVTMTEPVFIPADMDLTLVTTEYRRPTTDPVPVTYLQNGVTEYGGARKIIKRGAALGDKPMFIVSTTAPANVTVPNSVPARFYSNANSKLTIGDVTLSGVDGNNNDQVVTSKAPMVLATVGEVRTRTGSQLVNAVNTSANQGSAIDISGSATVDLRDVVISGNKSSTEKGSAVRVANSTTDAKPTVNLGGSVNIQNNTLSDGQNGNLLLVDKNMIGVGGDFPLTTDAKVGIATTAAPTNSNMGTPVVTYNRSIGVTPFSGANFTSDKNGNFINSGVSGLAFTTTHPYQIPGGSSVSAQDPLDLYVRANFYSLNIFYVDEFNNPMAGVSNFTEPTMAASAVLSYAAPSVSGKAFDKDGTKTYSSNTGITDDPVTQGLSLGTIKIDPSGNISGTMPERNVNLTIKYMLSGVQYFFSPMNGGTLITRNEPVSAGASSLGALPVVTRQNFVFDGWFEFTDLNGNHEFDATTETMGTTQLTAYLQPTAANAGTHHYVAKWSPDSTPYTLVKTYKNISAVPSIIFYTNSSTRTFTSPVNESGASIFGYLIQSATKNPTSTPTLNFNTSTGVLTGTMPAFNVGVQYNYRVDPSESAKSTLTVKHVDGNGVDLAAPEVRRLSPEASIDLDKKVIGGYNYNTVAVTAGMNDNPSQYIIGFNTSSSLGGPMLTLLDTANGKVKGYMPNQDVTITFTYGPSTTPGVTRRFVDAANPSRPLYGDFNTFASGSAVSLPFPAGAPQLYGYLYRSVNFTGGSLNADASGNLSGNMPASGGIIANFLLNKDASKWQHVHFATTTDSQAGATFAHNPTPNPVLLDDGVTPGRENAPTFATLKSDGTIPAVTPAQYYMLEGWYSDAAGTQRIADTDRLTTPVSGNKTIYAKIVEDPAQWFDITFNASANGSIAPVPVSAHVHNDQLWGTLIQSTPVISGDLPIATPVANYNFLGWYFGTAKMEPTTVIQRGTYTATFGKDAPTWGLNPGAFTPTGRIGVDGSGEVVVNGVKPGNVYVLVDPDGTVVGVATADPSGNNIVFPNQVPGRTYTVVEGEPGTTATVGQPEASIVGVNLSAPKPVLIPAIDTNRAVGIDPSNPEMAQIVINPADPDADYALIGPDGQVIDYPGSDGGWMTPVGNAPATVTFNNLIPGETYTVVARKKGNTSETPLGNLAGGVAVVANPGDMVEAPKYIIETRTNGIGTNLAYVATVNGQTVNDVAFEDAKRGESFTLHADLADANGNPFLYWQIMNGRIPGVTGRQTDPNFSGTMTNSNVVFRAVYDVRPTNAAGDSIAPVEQVTRGGSEGEFALDPSIIADLERTLSDPTDVSLININGADVRYNVVFNKRNPKGNETAAVKADSTLDDDHPSAFTAAWALDIKEERYVDGRLVQNASPSNAQVRALVQFDAQDTDMLDYEIWDLGPHVGTPGWTSMAPQNPVIQVNLITRTTPLSDNAGLVEFDANLNHTYVLVYSKTFKLSFIDNNQSLNHLHFDDTTLNFFKKIKVRKGDNIHDPEVTGDYMFDYIELKNYADGPNAGTLITPFEDVNGVQFDYVNWSKHNMPMAFSQFDVSAPVKRSQVVYAYYNNNRPAVEQARVDLTNLIPQARDLQTNPYLRTGEVQRLEEAILRAQNVLERRRGRLENGTDPLRMANYAELQAEIDALKALIDEMHRIINMNSSRIYGRTGGSGGGGGKGIGTVQRPLQVVPEETFMLGVDGNWAINKYTGRWSFELFGGYPLNNRWGKIEHTEPDGRTITEWYRFDDQASLVYGWYKDTKLNKWYYLREDEGKDLGKMVIGWHKDPKDGNWYYLDLVTGEMYTGWHKIGERWYYFNTNAARPTYDFLGGRWQFNNNTGNMPYGALYMSTTTPDGYRVNHDGEWVE